MSLLELEFTPFPLGGAPTLDRGLSSCLERTRVHA